MTPFYGILEKANYRYGEQISGCQGLGLGGQDFCKGE